MHTQSRFSDGREGDNTKSFSPSSVANLVNINLPSSPILHTTVAQEGLRQVFTLSFQKEGDWINHVSKYRALKYSLQTLKM